MPLPASSPYEYHASPSGVQWRHTKIPGILAITFETLKNDLITTHQFMIHGHSPLIIEYDDEPLAVAVPHHKDAAHSSTRLPTKSISTEQVKSLEPEDVRQHLGLSALILLVSPAEDSPRILLTKHTAEQSREIVADFAELMTMDEERIAAGHTTTDPETGLTFTNQFLLDPLGQNFLADMAAARRRRLNE